MARGILIDWYPHREMVLSRYKNGESSGMIAEYLQSLGFSISRPAVTAFLKREGVLRSVSESQSLACKAGRQDHNSRGKGQRRPGQGHHTFVAKTCEHCNEAYTALAGNQRFCDTCVPNEVAGHRMQRYRLSQLDFDAMFANQNGCCALCDKRARLVVDHCHVTDRVRGLLCYGCNIAMGHVDISGWLERARVYGLHDIP